MRIAVIGVGQLGETRLRHHLGSVDAEVVGAVDPNEQRRALAASLGVEVFPSLDALLRAAEPEVIDVCSPPVEHVPQAWQALDRCDVLCEKPALDHRRIDVLAPQLLAFRRFLYPGHNYHFSPRIRAIEAERERVGAFVSGSIEVHRPAPAGGVNEWRPNWRLDRAVALGGILVDHGVHCIYQAARLAGSFPVAVSCSVLSTRRGLDTVAVSTLRFPAGDVSIYLSWEAHAREDLLVFRGTDGEASVRDGVLTSAAAGDVIRRRIDGGRADSVHAAWFPAMFDDFVTTRNDEERRVAVEAEAIATACVLRSLYRSADQDGATVDVDYVAPTSSETQVAIGQHARALSADLAP